MNLKINMNLEERIAVRYPNEFFTIKEIEEIKEESAKKEIHSRICNCLINHVKNNGPNEFFLKSKYEYQIYISYYKKLLELEWNIDDKIFVFSPDNGWQEHEFDKLEYYEQLGYIINYKIYFSRKDQNG